ncbi:putative Haloacid dehalogenase-like hydrolase [Vibrio nigripulchritudo SOn1]|uniref:Haloacid dehalogenase-like hydrolase n=1 Tax=Vibrio nigripulchritudo SOn1 TaxID=1238450 RepID=A0AAV2VIR7_9VIBR|nr:HAD family phosphatase [Vibrio nigripulchritudo]CCO44550.1 putative Haloacid dehalogenase-like hydrolase [Vibrio nigripulchritudo SOn1]
MAIKNIIFDVGNVIVKWSPTDIIARTFNLSGDECQAMANTIFQHQIWLDINKGKISELEAKLAYQEQLQLTPNETDVLFYQVKATQELLPGTFDMMKELKEKGYALFGLTDNVNEIVSHLKTTYDFWPLFDGAIVSAEWSVLKPDPKIYQLVNDKCGIRSEESVFLDDMPHNIEGAKKHGFEAFQFTTAKQAREDLRSLGVTI